MQLEFKDVQTGTVYTVGPEGAVLGRERARTDIAFRDESISKRHARIFAKGSQWFIEDLDSSNGTYVRNERIFEPSLLRSGFQFSLAQRRFQIVAVGADDQGDTGRDHRAPRSPLAVFPQVVLHYASTIPRLVFLPVGLIRESIDEPVPPGRGPLELAVFGAVGGALAAAWTPLFELCFRYAVEAELRIPPSMGMVAMGAGLGLVGGAVAHPVVERGARWLGGVTARDSRSRLVLLALSFVVLAGLPMAATRVFAPLDPLLVHLFGAALSLWLGGVGLYAAFRWSRAMGLYRWAEVSVLVVGILVAAGGSASAVRTLWGGSERDGDGRPPARLEVPASILPGGPASPPTDDAFARYTRDRAWIESTLDLHPELLRDPELRGAYEKLLAAEAAADAQVDDPGRSEPWFEAHILRRLRSERRYAQTRDSVTSLARRLRRHLEGSSSSR